MTQRPNNPHDPRSIVSLLSLEEEAAPRWKPSDLAPMFQHQLRAPLVFDLEDLAGAQQRSIQEMTIVPGGGPVLNTFADVLFAAAPPIDLLELIKDYAKSASDDKQAPLPREVATVLYYLAIAAALVRCKKRITSLPDQPLRDGLAWAQAQPFIDDRSRDLLTLTLSQLSPPPPM